MSACKQQSSTVCRPFQWLASMLPLLVIGLGLLAVRPDWHEAMHVQTADAAHHDHGHPHDDAAGEQSCAIELFASGLVDSVTFSSPISLSDTAVLLELTFPHEPATLAGTRLEPPGRAPPFSA